MVFFLAVLIVPSTYAAPAFHLSSIESVPAQEDTVRMDSVIILEFTVSQRLERAHRETPFVMNFKATEEGVPDSSSVGSYQRLLDSPRDSTARIKYFTHELRDQPQVSLFGQRRIHPFFLKPSVQSIQWSAKLDTAGTHVVVREIQGGVDVRIPLSIPLEEYTRLNLAEALRRGIVERAHQYAVKEGKKDDFGDLISSVTKIEIPVPANPVLSIFGKPSISLNLSGDVNIKAAYRSVTSDEQTISALGSTRNEPDFAQVVRLNVDGHIGDKLAIRANWDTQTQFEYENRLSLVYTGYDDEIVKKVEAGNVSLSTPSSFIGSSQALFGIKATMQFGPLTLTSLVSQKKGQTQEASVSGGSTESDFKIYPYAFSTNHYFVANEYRAQYEQYYDAIVHQISSDELIISEIQVYKSRQNQQIENGQEISAIAFINLNPAPASGSYDDNLRDSEEVAGEIEEGFFVRLDPSSYRINTHTGILSLDNNAQEGEILAVAYRTNGGNTYGEFAAEADKTKKTVLKLVKPEYQRSEYRASWDLLVKNRYTIGGKKLKKEKFQLNILFDIPGQDPVDQISGQQLLQVFHLDKVNEAGSATPDGIFDFQPGYTIDTERGELIFPMLEPFRDAMKKWWTDKQLPGADAIDSLSFPLMYDTTATIARQNSMSERFYISGKYSAEVSARRDIGFNVVENSVQVLLDGVPLTPGTDYTVDYNLGQVTILREDALVPGKNVQIKYESNDLFQMASKTLTALRGDLRLGPTSNLGFTVMNYSQQTLSDKVRLGEEPMSNTMLGLDGSTKLNLGFLTDALNFLPSYYSKEISQFTVKGEAAYMLPDPNTKKSTIESDGNKGIAFIDDFEGSKRTIPLGISYTMWHPASPPKYLIGRDPPPLIGNNVDIFSVIPDSMKMKYKGNLYWYNFLPADVEVTDIWPEKKVAIDQSRITALTLHYDPAQRGEFNYSPESVSQDPRMNWGGIMKVVSSASTDLSGENINYIEFWMKITDAQDLDSAKMMIDLGRISEDVIPNGFLNTEDGLDNLGLNDRLSPEEDVGLDQLTNEEEKALWNDLGDDPSGDDYNFISSSNPFTVDYSQVNGTQGNQKTESGLYPDTEDMNRNGNLDLVDSYFEYEIPLDTRGGVNGKKNPFIVGGGFGGKEWYQFRIPLITPDRKVGSPSFTTVQYVRIWVTGTAQPIELRIVDLALVGNQWLEEIKNDSTLSVSTVGKEETPGYESPPGVIREQDKTKPNENVLANEQSLVLKIRGLKSGESRRAKKIFTSKPLDVFNYRTLKMFVRSDSSFRYTTATGTADAEFFFRFGLDTSNYYEYRAPLQPPRGDEDAGTQWTKNNVEIIFSELTALKQTRDSLKQTIEPVQPSNGPPGSSYTVVGQPTLTQIREISLGVRNSGDASISGEVWIDEIRVTDVDATPGWAGRLESTLKLADLLSTTAMVSRIDPFFHTLDNRFGNRNMNINWSVDTKLSLERFLPATWAGSTMSVSYTHSEQLSTPRYKPGTDMLVEEAAQRAADRVLKNTNSAERAQAVRDSLVSATQILAVTDIWALPSIRFNNQSKAWYVQYLLNRFAFSFSYTKANERSPVIEARERWSWSSTMSYAVTFGAENYYSPFQSIFENVPVLDFIKGWKVYYSPQNFSVTLAVQRGRITELQRGLSGQKPIQRTFTSSRTMSFAWKFTEGGFVNPALNYDLNITSSLVHLETDTMGNQRRFSQILDQIFSSRYLIDFGLDNGYTQTVKIEFRPRVPNLLKLDKALTINANYSSGYRWSNNFQMGELGKSTAVNTSLSLNTTFRLKQFTDPWFPSSDPKKPDSLESAFDLSKILKIIIKTPFLDFESFGLTFSHTNSVQNNGVRGWTGFGNFWGRAPFFQSSDPELGPSWVYQLGLVSRPSDQLTNFKFRSSFPFFSFDVEPGLRAPIAGLSLNDNLSQSNRFTLKTQRDLWKGASIDFEWKISWSFNRNVTLQTDTLGLGTTQIKNITTTGDVERSFFTLPPFFLFKPFKNGIEQVGKIYEGMADDPAPVGEKLAKAFEEGFETMPFLAKLFQGFLPRMNYTFQWRGLEKLPFVNDIATNVILRHAYQSNFSKRWTGGFNKGTTVESERISYGFQPLADISIQFKELWKGSFRGTVKYSTQTTYDLNITTTQIIEGTTSDLAVTVDYSRRGFELPLFGLSLSNDIDVSFSYTYNTNSRKTFAVEQLTSSGSPFEGSTRTVLEPRIKYVLSNRVSASVYYRRTSIKPEQGSRTIGQTTSEFGFDIRLQIGQ